MEALTKMCWPVLPFQSLYVEDKSDRMKSAAGTICLSTASVGYRHLAVRFNAMWILTQPHVSSFDFSKHSQPTATPVSNLTVIAMSLL